jgi:hypothetical protein
MEKIFDIAKDSEKSWGVIAQGIDGNFEGLLLEDDKNKIKSLQYGVKIKLLNYGFINKDGVITPSEEWCHSDFILIKDFIAAYVNGNFGGTLVSSIAYYSAENFSSFISGITTYGESPIMVYASDLSIPDDAKYVVLSAKNTTSPYGIVSANVLQGLVETLERKNMIQVSFSRQGYVRLTDGSIISSSTWYRTKFIPIDSFVEAHIYGHGSVAGFAYYSSDNDSAYLGGQTFDYWVTKTLEELTLPEGTKYIVICHEIETLKDGYVYADRLTDIDIKIDDNYATLSQLIKDAFSFLTKSASFSFDDVHWVLRDLTVNANIYSSAFDNPFLARLKNLHDKYGMKFSLFVFHSYKESEISTWYLSDTTSVFSHEFAVNADWLRWGVHDIGSYASCIESLLKIVGSPTAIDLFPRADGFAGNLETCLYARDSQCGIIGLLAPDDTRDAYYFDAKTSGIIYNRGKYFDSSNQLYFIRSLERLEYQDPSVTLDMLLTASGYNLANNAVLFTHEYELYNPTQAGISPYDENGINEAIYNKIVICADWVRNNGYVWIYLMDKVRAIF